MPQLLSDALEPTNVLFYGEGGSGKTTDVCAMAKLGRIWVANAESGIKRRALLDHGIPVENIEVFPGPGETLSYDGLEKEWMRIRNELTEDPAAYAGVGWDSITEIQQAMKDAAVADSVRRAARAGKDRSPWIVDQDNWRATNEQCRSLIRKFRDLPCHFAASALCRREQDDNSTVVYQPGVTPSLQGDVVLWFDIIGFTSVEEVDGEEEYKALFRPAGKYRGKDRFHQLPKYVANPLFDRVQAYVDGTLTLDKDPEWKIVLDRHARAEEQAAAAA